MPHSFESFVKSWFYYYNLTPFVNLTNLPKAKNTIRYTDTAMMFFVTRQLRDIRDLGSYQKVKYFRVDRNGWLTTSGPQSPFAQYYHRWIKTQGIIGTEKGVSFKKTASTFVVKCLAIKLWQSLDTDLSRSFVDIVSDDSNESWIKVLSTSVDPSSATYQNNSDLFMRDYQAVSFLRKYEGWQLGINTRLEALKNWHRAEMQCKDTNERFTSGEISLHDRRFLWAVKSLIQNILGPCPSVTQVADHMRLGPGATDSCPSKYCSVFDKLEQFTTVSVQAVPVMERLLTIRPEFRAKSFTAIDACHLDFVDKTFKTGRPIQKPEDYNSLGQLALGNLIRQRLKKFGLDLDKQATINGLLAKYGSLTGKIATVDLQSASDTIASVIVKMLLPCGWYNWLTRFRSPFIIVRDPDGVDKREVKWMQHKFSAMGNGYTFELESLIFLAITLVSCGYGKVKRLPSCIGVFGDDICCPTMDVDVVIKNLELCGFSVNVEKTFTSGPFRESCGADYFMGAPVRPYFQKDEIIDVTKLFTMANGIRRVSVRSLYYYGSDLRYRNIWEAIVSIIPRPLRVFGPAELGDSVVWANPSDGIDGEWLTHLDGCWTYRTGPIRVKLRGINLGAYDGGTLITAWGLTKSRGVSSVFVKLPTTEVVEGAPGYKAARVTDVATMLPRTFRKVPSEKLRYAYGTARSQHCSTQCDCPVFL